MTRLTNKKSGLVLVIHGGTDGPADLGRLYVSSLRRLHKAGDDRSAAQSACVVMCGQRPKRRQVLRVPQLIFSKFDKPY